MQEESSVYHLRRPPMFEDYRRFSERFDLLVELTPSIQSAPVYAWLMWLKRTPISEWHGWAEDGRAPVYIFPNPPAQWFTYVWAPHDISEGRFMAMLKAFGGQPRVGFVTTSGVDPKRMERYLHMVPQAQWIVFSFLDPRKESLCGS